MIFFAYQGANWPSKTAAGYRCVEHPSESHPIFCGPRLWLEDLLLVGGFNPPEKY